MPKLKTTDVLEMAIKIEEESYELYVSAKEKAELPGSRKLLAELAEEELKHKHKLQAILRDREQMFELGAKPSESIQDLQIVDYMTEVLLEEDADYAQILIYGAKREKQTSDFFRMLAKEFDRKRIGALFSRLAEEELKHKNKLEKEYDDYVLKEN